MKKTSEMVKLKDKTMYFPKVELTHDELYTLYVYGHAKPYVLRQIVVNIDMLENIIAKNSKNRPNKKDGYKYLLGKLQERQDEVMQDLNMYSWQIATPWSAKSGVLSKYTSQLSAQNEIDEYIETKMPHRFDDGCGYDRVYRVGSKIWQFSRQK